MRALPLVSVVASTGVTLLFAASVLLAWRFAASSRAGAAVLERARATAGALGALGEQGAALPEAVASAARAQGFVVTRASAGDTEADDLAKAVLADGRTRAETRGNVVAAFAPLQGGAPASALVRVEASLDAPLASARREATIDALPVLACALLLLPGLAYLLASRVSTYLRGLARVLERAAAGDISAHAPAEPFGAELADLGDSVARLKGRLAELAREMRDTVGLLDRSAGTLTAATAAQGRTISQQAATLQETQVTAQEIKQTSAMAAQRAEAVLQVAARAAELGGSGEKAIGDSLETLRGLRAQVTEIAQTIQALGARARHIGSITQTVKDLADQSNMLALNAAIEAVRSGEHGKSFAIVAREIRTLADQSIQATRQVRTILDDISGAVSRTVAITEAGAAHMEHGLAAMKTFGENFRELADLVKDDAEAVRQIASAVNQQNAGVTQIFSALTDQIRMMDESVARVASTDVAAAAVREIAAVVLEMAGRYQSTDGEQGSAA